MRWWPVALMLVFAGCADSDTEPEFPTAETPRPTIEPYHVSETLDLAGEPVDRTWQWSMSPDMGGNVRLEFEPAPASAVGPNGVCWRLEWPQGYRHGGSNCEGGNMGNVALQIGGGALNPTTLFADHLVPNTFTLRIWNLAPDAATVDVWVDTFTK